MLAYILGAKSDPCPQSSLRKQGEERWLPGQEKPHVAVNTSSESWEVMSGSFAGGILCPAFLFLVVLN